MVIVPKVTTSAPTETSLVVDRKNMFPGVAINAVVVERLASVVTDMLANVSPPEARLSAPAPLLLTVSAPVVFTVKLGVDVAKPPSPISPDPDASDKEVVPDKVPDVCEIAPVVSADKVTTVPLALAPSAILPPPPAIVDKSKVPVAVMLPDVVRLALLETETLPPVDDPPPILNVV